MESKRGQWGSNFGFLMAAIGSAVGLGNIWGFPYKMGATGGFAFLIVYLLLIVFVGFVVMLGEFVIGRRGGKSSVFAYKALKKNLSWLGMLGVIAGFIILAFYCVLGGYVLKYMWAFLMQLTVGNAFGGMSGGEYFESFMHNPVQSVLFNFIFMAITAIIVMGGIKGGIEKFCNIGMPALFIMLIIVIIKSCTLPGASAGLSFMFKPDFSAFKELGFMNILRIAAGQMFFSLSLGMGNMITYGSYLSKKEDLQKNAIIVPVADTLFALMAGMAVMPAVFAFNLEPAGGPSLLFVTLQEVFMSMGSFTGPFFGFLFYLLVAIAAITSSISLLEVCSSYLIDRNIENGKEPNRKGITIIMAAIVFVIGLPIAVDGLGSSGVFSRWMLNQSCWLDVYDLISEGILMPLGAMLMCIIIGWLCKIQVVKNECSEEGNKMRWITFCNICYKVIAPAILLLVLISQLNDFLGWHLF